MGFLFLLGLFGSSLSKGPQNPRSRSQSSGPFVSWMRGEPSGFSILGPSQARCIRPDKCIHFCPTGQRPERKRREKGKKK